MNRRIATVFQGYRTLTDNERDEFIETVNEYNRAGLEKKSRMTREATEYTYKVDMGPVSTGCPCCGR